MTLNDASHCRLLTSIPAGQLADGQAASLDVDHYGSEGWGFESLRARPVISQDIGMTPNPKWVRGFSGWGPGPGGRVFRWAGSCGGVEDEFADEFAGGGVDDADVQVVDEHEDGGSGVVRPMPMWWSFPPTRRVSLPSVSTRSVRTRQWVSAARSPGWALGRAV